ncbi:Ubiquinone/menaquinone biosynthesis C-methyltransferase UbiE [Amycolatopsis sp. CA-230715]|nr:Ubiquinone/menaquinone biosynthesis C-methyltransferase UbiE [Amycolatopsis sp. CA-230715]
MTQMLDRAFGHPRGLLGRLGGAMMAHGNAATERHLVELAKLGDDDTVLVVGPGPGVGLAAAARTARRTVGVDPSEEMLARCRDRCHDLIASGAVELRRGTAEDHGQPDESADAVLTVNNVQLWPDRAAAFRALHRALRPGGRILVSAHDRWLPVSRHELGDELLAAGFADVQTWTWEPPGRGASLAAQLRAVRPPESAPRRGKPQAGAGEASEDSDA